MNKKKVFEVEISNNGPRCYETAVVLEMPATWAEFNDALQRARIEDSRHCKNEVVGIQKQWAYLATPTGQYHIVRDGNLLELNLLAQRMSMLTDAQKFGFEGLVKMELSQRHAPLPLPKLINLTFNADQCCVAPHVFNFQELGQLLWDSEILPDKAMALLDQAEPESEYRNNLLAVFGKKHMEDEGGVITSGGYVEMSGALQEVYIPGEMAYFDCTDAPVVLEVCGLHPDAPGYDNCLVTILGLPASKETIENALENVDATSIVECGIHCVDCLIPAARELINDAIGEEGGIAQANAFARLLAQKLRVWAEADIVKYKALLEASGCMGLEDAAALAGELEQYELHAEIAEPWNYAEARLKEKYPDIPSVLFQTGQSYHAGVEMLEQDHAALTDYGVIRRKDGQPLPELRQEAGGMTQKMG